MPRLNSFQSCMTACPDENWGHVTRCLLLGYFLDQEKSLSDFTMTV